MTILVVEDDPQISSLLKRGLHASGFAVVCLDTAASAIRYVSIHSPAAILLDVALPDGGGDELCRSLRRNGFTSPIIFVSARGEVADRVDGLAAGGDDYIVKPFLIGELVARLQAQLLRSRPAMTRERVAAVGGLKLNLDTRRLSYAGVKVELTQREAEMLAIMIEQPDTPISREDFLKRLGLARHAVSANTIDVYIGYIRGKLSELAGVGSPMISTVRGKGFMLELNTGLACPAIGTTVSQKFSEHSTVRIISRPRRDKRTLRRSNNAPTSR